jgi:Leucine-rich repeat (LRR) protein
MKKILILTPYALAVLVGLLVLGIHSDAQAAAPILHNHDVHALVKAGICDSVTEIPLAECEALVTLYDNTSGATWTHNDRWMTTITPCNWYGVTCYSGQVTALSLPFNKLNGTLPDALGNLMHLTTLNLSENALQGTIPASLGSLSNLTRLELNYNHLSGSIPSEFGALTGLRMINLGSNDLTGSLPPELGQLVNLRAFFADNNALNGPIPPEFGNLTNLLFLYLHANNLSGPISPELGNLSNLSQLYLYGNRLSGPIPVELGNLIRLKRLFLMGNQLEGDIPAAITNLADLELMSTSFNMLKSPPAPVQSFIGARDVSIWMETQTVTPDNIQMVLHEDGSVEASWTPITYTGDGGYYEVGYAALPDGPYETGCVTADKTGTSCTIVAPPQAASYYAVRTYTPAHGYPLNDFWYQKNDLWSPFSSPVQLGGLCAEVTEIPVAECNALVALYQSLDGENWTIQDGWLQTTGPCGYGWHGVQCRDGHVISLSLEDRNLSGTIPPAIKNLTHLETLYLQNNQIAGPLPSEIFTLIYLRELYLDVNPLNIPIPTEIANLSALENLGLGGTGLTGQIPAVLGSMANLRRLELEGNSLTGPLPPELANLSNLSWLRLSYNPLNCSIPPEWGDMTDLDVLHIDHAGLIGSIPATLGNLSDLNTLDLAYNSLSGSIPPELGQLTAIDTFRLHNNDLSGSIPPQLAGLGSDRDQWTVIVLDDNHLSGTIPPELGNLAPGSALSLRNNRLSGPIPAELANLHVSQIFLTHNALEGEIPADFKNTTFWTVDVNYNRLTASDPELRTWLDSASRNWDKTQTTTPLDVEVEYTTDDEATVQWTPLDNEYWINLYSGEKLGPGGWLAEYYDDTNENRAFDSGELRGTRTEPEINLDYVSVPPPFITAEYFLIRWTRDIPVIEDGTPYQFSVGASGGVRIYADGALVLDEWLPDGGDMPYVAQTTLDAGSRTIIVEYYGRQFTSLWMMMWVARGVEIGHYEVGYSATPGGPYTSGCTTPDQHAESCTITGLTIGQTYYLAVRTFTPAFGEEQQNDLWSVWSEEISVTTEENWPPAGCHPDGEGIIICRVRES